MRRRIRRGSGPRTRASGPLSRPALAPRRVRRRRRPRTKTVPVRLKCQSPLTLTLTLAIHKTVENFIFADGFVFSSAPGNGRRGALSASRSRFGRSAPAPDEKRPVRPSVRFASWLFRSTSRSLVVTTVGKARTHSESPIENRTAFGKDPPRTPEIVQSPLTLTTLGESTQRARCLPPAQRLHSDKAS